MKKVLSILCASLLTVTALCGCGQTGGGNKQEKDRIMHDYAMYDGVELTSDLWTTVPEIIYDEENDRHDAGINGTVKALYYKSDYNGKESYAFAFLGIPEGVTTGSKCPAVLLVHGGGGTAYWEWVRDWVNNGYVALAMDLEGHVPLSTGNSSCAPAELYKNSTYTAPHNTNYGDAGNPIESTWMYYAVTTAIRGNTLLHSLDCVDRNKIGVCGVSWGGVITSIITGYDDRFAFSIPIYCSLNMYSGYGGGNLYGYYVNHAEARVWDKDDGLIQRDTPLFFLAQNDDKNCAPASISYTASRCKDASVSFVNGWLHSQTHAMSRREPFEFADSIVKDGKGLVTFLTNPEGTEGSVLLHIPKDKEVKSAYILCTDTEMASVHSMSWQKQRLTLDGTTLNYELTEDLVSRLDTGVAKYFYLCVEDNLGNVTSSLIKEL